jgi:hypothetical protein
MNLGRVALFAGWLVSAVGCGDGSSNGAEDEVDWSEVSPPPNVDITSCFGITEGAGEFGSECSACCMTAGFDTSSSINDDHCTCGEPLADDRDTVCAAEASQPTSAPCMSCCSNAGFLGYAWVGGGGASAQCECHGKRNAEVCAGSLAHAVPDEACSYCCLENGYLSSGYVGFGERECACISP